MKNILDEFFVRDAEKVEWAFNQLDFPIPYQGEYYRSITDSTRIVFLNCLGLTLRIETSPTKKLFRNLHLLRPIASFKLSENYRIDIQIGGKTGISDQDALKVWNKLHKSGIAVDDIYSSPSNSLRLPVATPLFPEGFPVAYDPLVITALNNRVKPISKLLHPNVYDLSPPKNRKPDIQDRCFGDLREQFAQSCYSDKDDLDKDAIQNFLQKCYVAVQQGRTKPFWISSSPALAKISRRYEKHLLNENKFLADLVTKDL